ncbi:hypothetical protein TNCV_406691 [Trichonephila clavipes]|nr:hypothetical protein TNCV_406691 [Trichonephila clavipes]
MIGLIFRYECILGGYLVDSGIESRPSGLESSALTTRIPTNNSKQLESSSDEGLKTKSAECFSVLKVAAIHDISRSCLDPNDFTVLNCIVKGHATLLTPSLRLRFGSRFTLLAT